MTDNGLAALGWRCRLGFHDWRGVFGMNALQLRRLHAWLRCTRCGKEMWT
jgi:hypothetical protein